MRQAIEEGFILDVLRNYTTHKLAFKLAHHGKEWDEKEVERSAAMRGVMGWVRLHPYNISQKVEVVVEHFRQYVAPLMKGQAKAMVVVGSRVEAVRWQLAIDKYVKSRAYPIRTLVAFSGEVRDAESGLDAFTETSPALNPEPARPGIREAFNTDEYQILLAANKFQGAGVYTPFHDVDGDGRVSATDIAIFRKGLYSQLPPMTGTLPSATSSVHLDRRNTTRRNTYEMLE